MIPKADLPFLKPLPDQVKRAMMIKKKRKIRTKQAHRVYQAPNVNSVNGLKNQIKRFTS